MNNNQIQSILNTALDNTNIIFGNGNYENISLDINKPLNITGNNTNIYGKTNQTVFNIKSENTSISNFNINANEGTGILIEKGTNIIIKNNKINNILNQNKIHEYNIGHEILPGHGVGVTNGENILIQDNTINNFENGVYLTNCKYINTNNNLLSFNNYGLNYDFNVSETTIYENNITLNVGNYTLDEPEGPLGYGIYLNNSANNVNITYNNIIDNYIGILIDSQNSSGIRITSNLVNENALEGITFWKHYNLTNTSVYPVVEDNAIYNNAKGPSMMILGEMSANPEGIYGPGEWNDDLKLFIGPNWYGVNHLVTWDLDGTVGAGSMCPRIKTSTIKLNLTYTDKGEYSIKFYKNDSLAVNLPDFTVYSTFNGVNDDTPISIVKGEGVLNLNKSLFKSSDNLIELSAGPLDSSERIYYVIFEYNIPESEKI